VPVIDPSGFQISIRIVTTDGDVYPLWMSPGSPGAHTADTLAIVDAALGLDGDTLIAGLPCVESVDIEVSLGMNSKVTVSLATPFDIGMGVLASPLLRIGNVIECQVGYPRIGRFVPWISSMSQRPDVRITPDEGLSVTLNGEGGAFIALRGSRSAEYTNRSYLDIIESILDRPGYEHIDLEPPSILRSDHPLLERRPSVSQQNQSDWFFIQHLVRSADCDAWMEPSRLTEGRQTLKILTRDSLTGAVPRYGFVMRGNPDFDVYFPILEFETSAEGTWLPGDATSVRIGGVSPDDLTATTVVVRREDDTTTATGESVAVPGGTTVEDTSVRVAHDPTDDTVGTHLYVSERDPRRPLIAARSHLSESAIRGGGIQVTITTIGIPDLFPGVTVTIIGTGVFDGVYGVQKVTHRVSAEEWTMTLELLNNATSARMMSSVISFSPAVVNTSTPPEPSGDAVGGGAVEVDPVEEG